MAISIKTPEEIEKMRVAGRLAAEVLEMIEPFVKPGVSTGELDRICNDYIVNEQHAVSACLGYHGFPKSVCISINEVVCHGIPDDEKLLKDGDIVNIDVTVIKDEYHGDGIGRVFHEEPQVLHYDADDGGVVLQKGMTFTIEPMVNAGDYRIRTMKDGWTVKTKDRSLSAQYEHTIVVTDNGCEIMTLRKDDTIPAILTHDE